MNKKLFNVLLFTAGAAIGSLVTWKVVKTKYEQIAQEEIDSVKEMWARRNHQETDENTPRDDMDELDDVDDESEEEYIFEESDRIAYHNLANIYKKSGEKAENDGEGEGDEEVPYINGPYVIEPNEFADGNYDHECHCIAYYADGVLADDWGVKLDIDETIGLDALEHFGDYAEDIVHIRNERLKADYEVSRDPRNYADVMANNPQMHMYAD